MTPVAEPLWGHQALDLGGLGVLLSVLGGDLPADNALADIFILIEPPELADLVGPLGSETEVLVGVGETFDLGITELGDDQVED